MSAMSDDCARDGLCSFGNDVMPSVYFVVLSFCLSLSHPLALQSSCSLGPGISPMLVPWSTSSGPAERDRSIDTAAGDGGDVDCGASGFFSSSSPSIRSPATPSWLGTVVFTPFPRI